MSVSSEIQNVKDLFHKIVDHLKIPTEDELSGIREDIDALGTDAEKTVTDTEDAFQRHDSPTVTHASGVVTAPPDETVVPEVIDPAGEVLPKAQLSEADPLAGFTDDQLSAALAARKGQS